MAQTSKKAEQTDYAASNPGTESMPEPNEDREGQASCCRTNVLIRVGPKGRLPLYATAGSAGCDLFASAAISLRPGETRLLPLDIVMAIEPGVEAQIRPRSGLSLKTDLRLPNAPGTIDSDYRDEVCVLLQNTFSQADLALQPAGSPELADRFCQTAHKSTLADYLNQLHHLHQSGPPDDPCFAPDMIESQYPELCTQILYLDDRGNPWGTLYIEPGDRIAQMVFSRHLQADFIPHDDPAAVGADRGGGFGSTGVR